MIDKGVHALAIPIMLLVSLVVSLASAGCGGPTLPGSGGSSGGASSPTGNGLLGWPFDPTQGSWIIENGYNWNTANGGLDHGCSTLYESCYELDSFDFQRRGPAGSTAGQTILSPATGTVLDVSSAVNGAGRCVRIALDGHDGYYVLICHVDTPLTGHREKGQPLGTVNARTDYGDHIHMTLYYLTPGTADTVPNASKRQAVPFSEPWTIAGCSYPADGSANQWHGGSVPCASTSCITSHSQTYVDDFSSYPVGQAPASYLLRGASGAAPTIQDVGGTGPAFRVLRFPAISNQLWDSWALESRVRLCSAYTVTVKLNFRTSGDRGGLTIAWNDATWDRIDIQPNIYFRNIEFRITYTGSIPAHPHVTGSALDRYSLPMNVGTDYWLRAVASSSGPGNGQVIVYWSTDGTHFTSQITATGLGNLEGNVGVGTAGPNLPSVDFDDLGAEGN